LSTGTADIFSCLRQPCLLKEEYSRHSCLLKNEAFLSAGGMKETSLSAERIRQPSVQECALYQYSRHSCLLKNEAFLSAGGMKETSLSAERIRQPSVQECALYQYSRHSCLLK
jgi:hypothetical protein